MGSSLLARLDARDRALFLRWAMSPSAGARRIWVATTHLGGLRMTALAAGLPLVLGSGAVRSAGILAALGLVLSHGVIQVIKRSVVRERPSVAVGVEALVNLPDEFSFPSGHATAAMAVAFAFALVFPTWGAPLVALAAIVGLSRVYLGVHFPGDVVAGQVIAIATDLLLAKLI